MANTKSFHDDIEVEQQIKEMPDRELSEFTARQVYNLCFAVKGHDRRIGNLEHRANKITGIAGAIGTMVGAAITFVFNFAARR